MSKINVNTISELSFPKWKDYLMLVKFRLSLLVVFTSIIGALIASGASLDIQHLILLGIAGMLTSGAANALNQALEKDFDVHMTRTKNRPVAAGRMKTSEAVMFAGISCLLGISILALFNPLTAFIGMLSLISYAFVYTPLKRYSTAAVAVGAVPGALPILIGFTSVQGEISLLALTLFAVQYLWQFPHFWSIGFLSFDDYKKAGYKLLPQKNGEIIPQLGLHAFVYAMLIVPVVIASFILESQAYGAVIMTVICSLGYALLSLNMYRLQNRKSALYLMFGSFFYLPIVLITYLISM